MNHCIICGKEVRMGCADFICSYCSSKIWVLINYSSFKSKDHAELLETSEQLLGFRGYAHGLILKYPDILYLIL